MGMSTNIVGFVPADEKWKKMKSVWDACDEANISIPDDVMEFFGHACPDPAGVEVDIDRVVEPCDLDMQDGWEVNIDNLATHFPNVKTIRFTNSY